MSKDPQRGQPLVTGGLVPLRTPSERINQNLVHDYPGIKTASKSALLEWPVSDIWLIVEVIIQNKCYRRNRCFGDIGWGFGGTGVSLPAQWLLSRRVQRINASINDPLDLWSFLVTVYMTENVCDRLRALWGGQGLPRQQIISCRDSSPLVCFHCKIRRFGVHSCAPDPAAEPCSWCSLTFW